MAKEKAGRGAIGSAKAHFFLPCQPIKDHLKSNYNRGEFHNDWQYACGGQAEASFLQEVSDGLQLLNQWPRRKQHLLHCLQSPVTSHLKVTQEGPTPFEDEVPTVYVNEWNAISDTVAQLHQEGIKVDNKDVAP